MSSTKLDTAPALKDVSADSVQHADETNHLVEARHWFDALKSAHEQHNVIDMDLLLACIGSLLLRQEKG